MCPYYLKLLELCCGENQSTSKVARVLGWETLTLDSNPDCHPGVVADIRCWNYEQYPKMETSMWCGI